MKHMSTLRKIMTIICGISAGTLVYYCLSEYLNGHQLGWHPTRFLVAVGMATFGTVMLLIAAAKWPRKESE